MAHDVKETMELIKELVSIPSPSGNTEKIIRFIENYVSEWNVETKRKNLFKIFLIKLLHLPISNSVCYFQVFVHSSSTVCGNFPTKQKFVPQSSV
ncbi:hypothetical protein ABE43_30475 [Bacillus thuringiensis]|nr:hypothetical protein [Bacillus thuringiensis]